jgi:hypothetical protein
MKKVSAQYKITRYRLTIGSWLLVTENSAGMRTLSTREPSRLWLDYGAIATHRNSFRFADNSGVRNFSRELSRALSRPRCWRHQVVRAILRVVVRLHFPVRHDQCPVVRLQIDEQRAGAGRGCFAVDDERHFGLDL